MVCVVLYCVQLFWQFSSKPSENIGRFHRKENTNFPKRRLVRSKNVFLSSGRLVALVVTKNYVLRTSWGLSTWKKTCFLFICRVTFGLRWLSKAAFDNGFQVVYLRYTVTIVKKQFFIFWKRGLRRFGLCTIFLKLSVQIFEKCRPMSPKPINLPLKMKLREAQSLRFELCFACFSSCEWKSCCEKFEINVCEILPIFVRLQCWVLPALVFKGYVYYFGSLHPAFEMSCDTEYL